MKKKLGAVLMLAIFGLSCQKQTPDLSTHMDDHFYVRNNGSDMPVFVRGNASTKVFILLLHGGPGDGSLKYRNHPFSDALEADYAIAYWDQRHQGNAHGHLKAEDVTIQAMVEDTYTVIETLKRRYGNDISVFMLGHSWGGLLGSAFMVTKDYQYQLKGWIESAGAHDFPLMNQTMITKIKTIAPGEIAKGNSVDKWQEILDYVSGLDTNNITLDQASKLNAYAYECEGMIQEIASKSQTSATAFERFFLSPDNPIAVTLNGAQLPNAFTESILKTALTDQLYKIQIPTLMLWGKYDFAVPYAIAEIGFQKLGSTDKALKIYNKSGHSAMRYEPEAYVADVKAFINEHK